MKCAKGVKSVKGKKGVRILRRQSRRKMKTQETKLNKRQLNVLDELFAGNIGEQQIFEKYKISRSVFESWLGQTNFISALRGRIAAAYQQSAMLLARYAPLAAARLIALTESDKPETARRACLDIIEMGQAGKREEKDEAGETRDENMPGALSDQAASRILAALAEASTKN